MNLTVKLMLSQIQMSEDVGDVGERRNAKTYMTEIVLSNKITRKRIVLSFKDSPRKPLRRRPHITQRR